MKMIVGLGNPGKEYERTHHNIGFMFIDSMDAIYHYCWKVESSFQAMIAQTIIGKEKVLFVKPLTYMNLSGQAVVAIRDYYKIENSDILIIHDDMDLPLAKVRIRKNGSSAGHNGMKSIFACLKTQDVQRIRIGIGHPEEFGVVDYVLSKFSKMDQEKLDNIFIHSSEMIEKFVNFGMDELMKYNAYSFEKGMIE